MPTMGGWGRLLWCYRSTVKFTRKSRQRINGAFYLIVDRRFNRRERVYEYKMVAAR